MFWTGAAPVRPGILLKASIPVSPLFVAYSTTLSQYSPPMILRRRPLTFVSGFTMGSSKMPCIRLIIITPIKPSSWPIVLAP